MANKSNPPEEKAGHSAHDTQHAPDLERISPGRALVGAVVIVLVFAVLAVIGKLNRMRHDDVLAKSTNAAAAPTVIALRPKAGRAVDTFVLPGNVTAFTDSPIYARTSGYLMHWYYDIGTPVKKGALLAEISTPEVDQQLAQAEADLVTAQANAMNVRSQSQRYEGLVQTNAVSQQDAETLRNQASGSAAAVKSAQANVQRLKELQSFEKVYAPFDGVVTGRSVDIGQLIDSGAGKEMFHIQLLSTLRVYANVPQQYSATVRRGEKIDITFPERPGKIYQGTLVRTAESIDPASRTLLVEIDLNNHNGELLPGSLAQVHFKAPANSSTYILPASALIFRSQGTQVATVTGDNKAHLASVVIGQDDGATVQIVSGLNADDRVIQDPPDALIEGEAVVPQEPRDQTQASPANGGKL
jgi:RND family efflux transporter MFP subunit